MASDEETRQRGLGLAQNTWIQPRPGYKRLRAELGQLSGDALREKVEWMEREIAARIANWESAQ